MNSELPTLASNVVSVLRWSAAVPLDVVEMGPREGTSYLELPGPKRRPVRPHLESFASMGGIAGRVVKGNGEALPLAATVESAPRIIPLHVSPLALRLREDGGLWVLAHDLLAHHSADGTPLHSLELSSQFLVGAPANDVWAIDVNHEAAWLIAADGQKSGPFAWSGGVHSIGGLDGSLYSLSKGISPTIRYLTVAGTEGTIVPPVQLGPMERLLTYDDGRFCTAAGPFVSRYDADGTVSRLTIQSAGLTEAGDAFVAGRDGEWINVWIAHAPPMRIPVPRNFPEWGAITAVAIDSERVLINGLDYASWYAQDRAGEPITVDDTRYREDVFPHAWNLNALHAFEATADGRLYLSASGPPGIAVLELHW